MESMAPWLPSPRALFVTLAILAMPVAGTGCNPQVKPDTGGDGGEGGQGGASGSTCSHYEGDGCKPGDTKPCVTTTSSGTGGASGAKIKCLQVPGSCETNWENSEEACWTPLVLSFESSPVRFIEDCAHGFALSAAQSAVTDWPAAQTPWLAFDRNGNGIIDDGSELFGSMSPLASGGVAANGFLALRELDANHDGRITPEDPGIAKLLVWSDRNADRASAVTELSSAAAHGLLSIDLAYTSENPRCDVRGNCEVERASFRYRDAAGTERAGTVIDVHLAAFQSPASALSSCH